MKIKSFKNIFGKDCYIYIEKLNLVQNNIRDIIDIFNSERLLISVVALDHSSEFFNRISKMKDTFEILLPTFNTITAETKVIASTEKTMLFWDKLIDSEPRSITIYGLKYGINNTNILIEENVKNKNDNKFIREKIVDFILSIVIDENFAVLSFNKSCFDFKRICEKLKL